MIRRGLRNRSGRERRGKPGNAASLTARTGVSLRLWRRAGQCVIGCHDGGARGSSEYLRWPFNGLRDRPPGGRDCGGT
jgi:hypothetical protein